MGMKCYCYACANKESSTTARNFDSTSAADTFRAHLTKELLDKGLELNPSAWQLRNHHWIYSFDSNSPRGRTIYALRELKFEPWNYNSKVYVHAGHGYPIFVSDREMILLGQSVPDWDAIKKAFGHMSSGKVICKDTQPLGFMPFSIPEEDANTSISRLLKSNGFVKKMPGLLFSEENDLEVVYSKKYDLVEGKIQQPKSDFLKLNDLQAETPALPSADTPTKTEFTKEELEKVPHVAIPDDLEKTYLPISRNFSEGAALVFMTKLWKFLNAEKFASKLTLPTLALIKNTARMRTRGYWSIADRALKMSPKTFNAPLAIFVEIFLHEMCHEAVQEIDKVYGEENGGHGPHWARWMQRVGLNPLRYDKNNNDTYLTDQERMSKQIQNEHAQQYHDSLALVPATRVHTGKVVQIVPKKGEDPVHGVICYMAKGRIYVVVDMINYRYWAMPPNLVFEPDPDEVHKFEGSMWDSAVRKVASYLSRK